MAVIHDPEYLVPKKRAQGDHDHVSTDQNQTRTEGYPGPQLGVTGRLQRAGAIPRR